MEVRSFTLNQPLVVEGRINTFVQPMTVEGRVYKGVAHRGLEAFSCIQSGVACGIS